MENYIRAEASLIKQMSELHFSNFSLMLLYSLMRKAWLLKAHFVTASPLCLLIGVCIYFQSEHNPQNTMRAFIIYYMFRPFWPLSGRYHNNMHGKVFKACPKKGRTFTIKTLFYNILSTVPFKVVPSTGDTPFITFLPLLECFLERMFCDGAQFSYRIFLNLRLFKKKPNFLNSAPHRGRATANERT
jgi:hypothetical protein